MHLHPNCAEAHLDTPFLDSGLEIYCFSVLCSEQEASVAGLLPRDDFDMQLSAFINVADYRFNHDVSRNIPATQKVVGPFMVVRIDTFSIHAGPQVLFDTFLEIAPKMPSGDAEVGRFHIQGSSASFHLRSARPTNSDNAAVAGSSGKPRLSLSLV